MTSYYFVNRAGSASSQPQPLIAGNCGFAILDRRIHGRYSKHGSGTRLSLEELNMDFIEEYKKSHTHPMNHLTHAFGIPMILVSLPTFFFRWKWALALFTIGWILQFIGHFFEGKPPAFFKNPLFLLAGAAWWFRKIAGLEKPDSAKKD